MQSFSPLERSARRFLMFIHTEDFRALGSGRKPALDWKLCASAFLVGAALFVLVGGFSYLAVIQDDLGSSDPAALSTFRKIDQKRLTDAEAFFRAREEAGKAKSPSLLDPSL